MECDLERKRDEEGHVAIVDLYTPVKVSGSEMGRTKHIVTPTEIPKDQLISRDSGVFCLQAGSREEMMFHPCDCER